MAFNNVGGPSGKFSLASGSQVGAWISWGTEDLGAQWIMADPVGPGKFTVSEMTKEKTITVPNSLSVTYSTTVTNVGDDIFAVLFTIQGGGNV
ncbi:hypothetical protein EVC45_38180 [Paraburkholderia sp. UYCP14C]|uniref:hypothetical protein n=1 Tax=Paraburkholderia sp. UYCP14C TaxID=2511130 RepID=UPI0010213727|nr:hypothetical protein [Paraburkholderia sp. UYCP14C]RZF24564.1 hypothetical protein EVC45_38180 [Paraburkholderia sp. UYCP14C]